MRNVTQISPRIRISKLILNIFKIMMFCFKISSYFSIGLIPSRRWQSSFFTISCPIKSISFVFLQSLPKPWSTTAPVLLGVFLLLSSGSFNINLTCEHNICEGLFSRYVHQKFPFSITDVNHKYPSFFLSWSLGIRCYPHVRAMIFSA